MVDKLWDNLVDQLMNLVRGKSLLDTGLILVSNLASEAAQVFVTPTNQVQPGTCEAILKRVSRVFLFGSNHAQDTC